MSALSPEARPPRPRLPRRAARALRPAPDGRTFGQLVAERVAGIVGSWPFIIGQGCVLAFWFIWNVLPFVCHWDPYPWLAGNIVMSAEAAFTGPILLIAANVSASRDRHLMERVAELEERQATANIQNAQILAHLDRLASFDHEDHARQLRELRELLDRLEAHTRCTGHTIIEGPPEGSAA